MTSTRPTVRKPNRKPTPQPTRRGRETGLVALEYVVVESMLAVLIVHYGPQYAAFFSEMFERVIRVFG